MISGISCVCPRHVHLVIRGQSKAMRWLKCFLLLHWPRMYKKDKDNAKKKEINKEKAGVVES